MIAENKEKDPKTPLKRFLTRLKRQLCFGIKMSVITSPTFMHVFQRSRYERIWYNFGPKLGLFGLQKAPENDKLRFELWHSGGWR